MADWRQYISILSPSTANSIITFELETFDAVTNTTVTLSASALTSQDEIDLARSFKAAFDTTLAAQSLSVPDPSGSGTNITIDMLYDGTAAFTDQGFLPTFRITVSDHVVCFWSQSQFRLSVTTNTSGAVLKVGKPSPTLLTLTEARSMSSIMGMDLLDSNGDALSDTSLALMLEMASDKIIKLIANNLVLSSHYDEFIGYRTGSVKLRTRPVLTTDTPTIRRPYGDINASVYSFPQSYNLDRKSGYLNYIFTNDEIDVTEAFDLNNEVKITYIAGYQNIPTIVKEKILQISAKLGKDTGIKSLQGGSGKVEYLDYMKTLQWIVDELREFKLG